MKTNVVAGLLSIILAIGLSVGYHLGQASKPQSNLVTPLTPETSGLQRFVDEEIQDYYRLKTLEQRYQKADELLGKMLLIIMADLGLRISPELKQAMEIKLEPNSAQANSSSALVPLSTQRQTTDDVASKTIVANSPMPEMRNENDAEAFLKANRPEHFEQILNSAVGLTKRQHLQNLNGHFTGLAKVVASGKPATWDVELTLNGKIMNGSLEGEFRVLIYDKGKIISNKGSNGSIDSDVREIPSQPNAVLLEIRPKTYLQAFYVEQMDALVANIIERKRIATGYDIIGTTVLHRQ